MKEKKLSYIGMISISIIILITVLGLLFPYYIISPLSPLVLLILIAFAIFAWKDYNGIEKSGKIKIAFFVLVALVLIIEIIYLYGTFLVLNYMQAT